jgi:Osmosensitive K+ channel histidine kinase
MSNVKLLLRLAGALAVGLLLLALLITAQLALVIELLYPQDGDTQDMIVLICTVSTVVLFISAFGWFMGRPIFYVIQSINRLANGIYDEPAAYHKLYSRRKHKLKLPYRLFKELVQQLHALSDALESSRQERQRLDRMQKEWIAGISHDLKTPLTYLKGYSAMLLSPQYVWTPEEQTRFLTEIQQKALHMEELIGDLNLSFRLDGQSLPLHLEAADAVEFVRRIVADASNDPRASSYSLAFESAADSIVIQADRKLLQRALLNLAINAIVHNPPGTNVQTTLHHDGTELTIVIADNGVGMSPDELDQLFNKYYRGTTTDRHSDGTGLGMAIAKQIIEAHQGRINVQSKLNEGTSIIVTLPFPLHC